MAVTEDGTPWSATYGDVYHTTDGGPGQARHVFLGGNNLPERWQGKDRFVILETGFGTGLNFLATWAAWRDDPGRADRLHYLSVEKHPFRVEDLAVLHERWPELADLSRQLRAVWPTLVPGFHRLEFEGGRLTLTLLLGDAELILPQLQARIDAIYLDGFSPAKNPDLWSPQLFKRLGRMVTPDATLATWSVAGSVRRALEDIGFSIEKRPGFGHKREMLTGRFSPKPWQTPHPAHTPPARRHAIVIGAGLAGTACCDRLASRGWRITLIDGNPAPAMAASGNLAGIVMPLVSRDDNIASRLSRAAYLHALRTWRTVDCDQTPQGHRSRAGGSPVKSDLMPAAVDMADTMTAAKVDHPHPWSTCGVLQLARDSRHEQVQRALVGEMGYPPEFVTYLNKETAEARVGQPLPCGGWLFSQGGWAHPPGICTLNMAHAGDKVQPRFGETIQSVQRAGESWQVLNEAGNVIAEAAVVILASGADASLIAQARHLPLQRIRGQVSHVPQGSMPTLSMAVCREGYATPGLNGFHAVGASYDVDDDDTNPRIEDNAGNLARMERLFPGVTVELDPAHLSARVGFRAVPPDRLPLVGALPDHAAACSSAATQLRDLPRHDGLYAALGYASRGLVWSALMAELLVCQIEGEPLPMEKDLADAVDPGRFLLKQTRRRSIACARNNNAPQAGRHPTM